MDNYFEKKVTKLMLENTNNMEQIYLALDKRIQNLEAELHNVNKTLSLLYSAIKGTELDTKAGIITKIEDLKTENEILEARIQALEKQETINSWQSRVFWLIAGVVVAAVITGVLNSFKK